MKRRCQVIEALVLTLGLGIGTASAQPLQVAGIVLGPGGTVVEGVRVRLEAYGDRYDRALRRIAGFSGSGEVVDETVVDAAGLFSLDAPDAGMWRVVVEAPGYRTMEYRLQPLCEPRDLPALELEPALAVEVRAVDVAGRPVPAAVALYDKKGKHRWRRRFQIVHTGEDGVARFERAHAEEAGFVALALEAASGLAHVQSDAVDGRIVLEAGVTGVLYVQDAAGASVAGAVVYHGSHILPPGVTDAEGRLAIALGRDDPKVWILAKDGSSGLFEIDLSPGAARVQLEPPEPRRGRVVEEGSGEPIAGAFVLPSYSRAGRSDARGQFSIDVPVIETRATFVAAAAGYADVRERFEDGMPESFLFQLRRAAVLRGTVVDADGRPVPGCDVHANALAGAPTAPRSFPPPRGYWRARTDRDGRFAVSRLTPGASYEVVADMEGYASARGEIDEVGPDSPELRLVLVVGRRAHGRLIDDDERPVHGAVVQLIEDPPAKRSYALPPYRGPRSFSTDADGHFTATDLGPGRYDIEVKADGYVRTKYPGVEVPRVDDGGATDLGTFVLERGATIAGRVVDEDGRGVAGAKVGSRAVEEHHARHETETQADGGFAIVGLRPEEERVVEVDMQGFAPSAALAVARREDGGEAEPLLIVLRPPGTISGRVVDGEGRPVAGAEIWAQPDERSLLQRGYSIWETDVGGRFEIRDVPVGTVALGVRAEGYYLEALPGLSVPPGGELTGVEVVLKPGVSIHGRGPRNPPASGDAPAAAPR